MSSVLAGRASRTWSGLLHNSRSSAVQALIDADTTIATPVPLTVRIGVTSADGGVGTSSVAGGMAALFGARRRGATLLVAASGNSDALRSAGLQQVEEDAFLAESPRRSAPQRLADAMHGLPVTEQGLHCLDLAARTSAIATPTVTHYAQTLAPIARYLDLVCTDFGRRARSETTELAGLSDVTVVACRTDRDSLDRASEVVDHLLASDHQVVVCVTDLTSQVAPDSVRIVTQGWEVPVHQVPWERALARPGRDRRRMGLDWLTPRYRRRLIGLAADVMSRTRREASA